MESMKASDIARGFALLTTRGRKQAAIELDARDQTLADLAPLLAACKKWAEEVELSKARQYQQSNEWHAARMDLCRLAKEVGQALRDKEQEPKP